VRVIFPKRNESREQWSAIEQSWGSALRWYRKPRLGCRSLAIGDCNNGNSARKQERKKTRATAACYVAFWG